MNQYKFKISLDNTSPEIWRKILVRSNMNLLEFHLAIQISMGWTNSHLYEFKIENNSYQTLYENDDDYEENDFIDAGTETLERLLHFPGEQFSYLYDFGDCWKHTITFEKSESASKIFEYPLCIDGAQSCPPEDCGGLGGYYEMLKILKSGSKAQKQEYHEWLGKKFDPAFFDVKKVNKELKQIDEWIVEWFADDEEADLI